MDFMIFNNYVKTQLEKMKLFAEFSRGIVLDIDGAGNPNKFLDASDFVKEVYLLDIKEPKKQFPYKYNVKNEIIKGKLPFNDEVFETVIVGDVLEHLHHPLAVLHDIKRVLKKQWNFIYISSNTEFLK